MLGALIGAGASLIGGLMGQKSQDNANAQQMRIANRNIALQKEFAQSGIQWKVRDAQKAGVHPLYALGAQTTSFSPISIGSSTGSPLGQGIAAMGQDIGRAVSATQNQTTRQQMIFQEAQQGLTLQNMELQNQLLASQIAKMNQAAAPPMPVGERFLVDGQSSSGVVTTKPMEVISTDPANPHMEAGAVSDVGFTRTADGNYAPVMSNDAKQRLEDDTLGMIAWNMRNRLLPAFGFNNSPPPVPVPKGYDSWVYDAITNSYKPMKRLIGPFHY